MSDARPHASGSAPKTRGQDFLGLVLAPLGAYATAAIVLMLRGGAPREGAGFFYAPVTGLASLVGTWPALILAVGTSVLGVRAFFARRALPVGRQLLGLVAADLGLCLALGAASAGAGGEFGTALPDALPGTGGGVAAVVLGLIVFLTSVWVAWLGPAGAASQPTGRRLGISADPSTKTEGVSAAEAAALVTELDAPRATPLAPASRLEPASAGVRPLTASDERSPSEEADPADAEGARPLPAGAQALAAAEPAGQDLAEGDEHDGPEELLESRPPEAAAAAVGFPSLEVRPLETAAPTGGTGEGRFTPAWEVGDVDELGPAVPLETASEEEAEYEEAEYEDEEELDEEPEWEEESALSDEEALETPVDEPVALASPELEEEDELELEDELEEEEASAPESGGPDAPAWTDLEPEPQAIDAVEVEEDDREVKPLPPAATPSSMAWEQAGLFDTAEEAADELPFASEEEETEEVEEEEPADALALEEEEDEEEYEEEEDDDDVEGEYAEDGEEEDEEYEEEEDEDEEEYEVDEAEGEPEEEYEEEYAEADDDEGEEDDEEYEEEVEEEDGELVAEADEEPEVEDDEPVAEVEEEAEEVEAEYVLEPQAAPEADEEEPAPPQKAKKPRKPRKTGGGRKSAKPDDASGDGFRQKVHEAGCLVLDENRVAVSMIERRFEMEFDDACKVLDELQEQGLIGPYVGGRTRDILLTREEWMARSPVG